MATTIAAQFLADDKGPFTRMDILVSSGSTLEEPSTYALKSVTVDLTGHRADLVNEYAASANARLIWLPSNCPMRYTD